ncbi:MAG: AAA family ATPase, partial [Candidatus Dormibacteria bacterium]
MNSFVGRTSEVERLHAELREVRGGRPRLALVEGSSGVGKSALIRRFLEEASDLRVLIGTGDEGEALLPYGVIHQLVRSSHAPVPAALAGIGGGDIHVRDPLAVGAGLLELLSHLQSEGPVAIVVDDAQWADRPSLQALLFTLRRLDADCVLTVIGARDDVPYPLREGLVRLLESGHGSQQHLTGLDSAAIRELATAMGVERISLTAAERIRDHTAGSPLY